MFAMRNKSKLSYEDARSRYKESSRNKLGRQRVESAPILQTSNFALLRGDLPIYLHNKKIIAMRNKAKEVAVHAIEQEAVRKEVRELDQLSKTSLITEVIAESNKKNRLYLFIMQAGMLEAFGSYLVETKNNGGC